MALPSAARSALRSIAPRRHVDRGRSRCDDAATARARASGSPDRPPARVRRHRVVLLLVWLLGPIVWIAIASVQPEAAVTQPSARADARPAARHATPSCWPARSGTGSHRRQPAGHGRWSRSIALVLGALAAYPLARLELPGKRAIMTVLIFTQMVPAIVMAIPVLLIFRAVGLKDTVAGLVIVNVAFWLPLIIWLLRNVLEDVPRSLEYAARIDGCSRLGTLFRVLVPAAAPGFAAVAILLLIGTWNEFLFAVMLGDRNAVTVTRLIGFLDSTVGPGRAAAVHGARGGGHRGDPALPAARHRCSTGASSPGSPRAS